MIYTVTLNPSLDYIVSIEDMELGRINRTGREQINPGGKGINVSLVLRNLGYESIALGFSAGFTGKEILRLLEEEKVTADFITVQEGCSRINIKIRSKQETELNGMGPVISEEEKNAFFHKLDRLMEGDILHLAGSIPQDLSADVYGEILRYVNGKKIRTVVDASGSLFVQVLNDHPFLVKPNHLELGEIFHVSIQTKEECIFYAKKLQEMGAGNVLVSMAGAGAVLAAEDGSVFQAEAPKGVVRNSVGAGDSMVAGFLAGYLETGSCETAFYQGLCTGSASAFSEGMATRAEVEELMKQYNR